MKNNLSLFQPLEYNNLFSSYHNNSNKYRYKNYNLPKIPKIFPSQEHKEQNTTSFFNTNFKVKIKNKNTDNSFDIQKRRKLIYPFSFEKQTNYISNNITNREIKPITLYNSYKKNHRKLMSYKNKEKLNNSHRLNMIYLNLFKSPLETKNNNILNIDSFYNFEIKDNNSNEDEILSQKYKQINNYSIIKIKNIFNETDFGKINDDFLNINNNITNGIIDTFIEKFLNKKKDNIKKDENNSNDVSYINGEKSIVITNNVFLDWILDNVRRKIELKNEFNQHLSTVWVKNLIYSEINELKNRFSEFRNSIKFSNFLEYMNSKKKLKLKALKKNDKSNITSSTLRSYFDNSYLKNIFNNSNLNSNINNENKKISKNSFTQNTMINNITMGFDFFDNNNSKKIVNYNDKKIMTIKEPYKTNKHLIKKQKYISYKKALFQKNKTELNHNNKENENLWFKNVFLNNPRSNKIKNFEIPDTNLIKSRFKDIKNNGKPNCDIINIIRRNLSSNEKYNYYPKNNDFYNFKRRNSFNFSNNEEKNKILKIRLINIDDNKNNVTPSKELVLNKGDDLKRKPKFKNVILMNIEKLFNKKNKKTDEDSDKNINKRGVIKSKNFFKFSSQEVEDGYKYKKKTSRKRKNISTSPKIKKIKNKRGNKKKGYNGNYIPSSSSSSASSSFSNEESKKDTKIDIQNEINKKIRRNLVNKRLKTQKAKLSSLQLNKLKKLINNNPNYNKKEDENKYSNSNSNSLLSISSVNEQQDLNENIDIKKEIDLVNKILSNNESYNLFNLIMELKNYLKMSDKTEEIKNEIRNKRLEIKNIIHNFFENLLSNLSIQEINEEQHLEIFQELSILKKYCSFSSRELNFLKDKILDKRKDEVSKYKMGYKFLDKKNIKKYRRHSAIETIFNGKDGKMINDNKDNNFKIEFKRGKRKKTNLIYNNSYLFKENDSDSDDDKNQSNVLIKKEIQDILNTDYGKEPIKISDSTIFVSRRRKKEEYIKRNYVKRKTNIMLLKINDELLNEETLLKKKKLKEESEEEMKKEKIRDKKIYEFFEKIQRLKKGTSINYDDELNLFIDKQIEQNNEIPKEKNGGRLNIFLQDFLSNRIRAKFNSNLKNKRIAFLSPIIFTSPNETYILNKSENYRKK